MASQGKYFIYTKYTFYYVIVPAYLISLNQPKLVLWFPMLVKLIGWFEPFFLFFSFFSSE